MRILLLLVSLALVGGDYAPSPQNPFVNVTNVPPPPAASIPSSNGSSLAAPHGFTFTTKKLVLTILGTIVGTFLMLGATVACIWFIVKCIGKGKIKTAQAEHPWRPIDRQLVLNYYVNHCNTSVHVSYITSNKLKSLRLLVTQHEDNHENKK